MANGTIGVNNPYNSTTLFSSSVGVDVTNNVTITLNDDVTNYKFLILRLYKDSVSSSGRGELVFPAISTAACYYPLACGGVPGYVRVERSASNKFSFLSTSYSKLILQHFYGVK